MIPYILTDHSLTVVIDGKANSMANDHPAWNQAQEALTNEDWPLLESLFNVEQAVVEYFNDSEAGVEVADGAVYYEGEIVHNYCVDKILDFMRNGLPHKPLVKFFGKLMQNPSRRATEELYRFLEHKNMPITPEGNFLAYKGVNDNFTDKYTGKFSNAVGEVLKMARNGVNDDANVGCSSGFHAGSYEYAKGYASGGGNLMVVEIDPSNVVSVPHDCDCQKLRTSEYKVVGHYETIEAPALPEYDDELPSYVDWDENWEDEYSDEENEAYAEGYKAAQADMQKHLNN